MAKEAYSELLRKPKWQKKRLEILNRDGFTCCLCGDKETELHVHHKEYISGRQPWEYDDNNFQTLCKVCHCLAETICLSEIIKVSKEKMKSGSYGLIIYILFEGEKCFVFSSFKNGVIKDISPIFGEEYIMDTLKLLSNG